MSKQSPYFLLYREKLLKNLTLLQEIESRAGITILHTLKSFNEATILPTISSKISGFSVSSKGELKLAKEANAKKLHTYSPAFVDSELQEFVKYVDTISFNSLSQWDKFTNITASKGLRLNPMLDLDIPNYCNYNSKNSHLGVDYREFLKRFTKSKSRFKNLEGLHFHALFKSDYNGVKKLFEHILNNYRELLPNLKWLNLGGGHNFTSPNYNIESFFKELTKFKEQYPNIELIFEPGEAVLHNCGEFVCTVLDINDNGDEKSAILNTSTETHLLDVAITKLKPKIKNAVSSGKHSYKLCGNSCQNGDIIGKYSFEKALKIGDELIFEDMLSYTLVKLTRFGRVDKPKLYVD